MIYNVRTGPDFEAHVWNKNGDHPDDYRNVVTGYESDEFKTWTGEEAKNLNWEGQVVRYFRVPDPEFSGEKICSRCGHTYHEHGWIDDSQFYEVPGIELIPHISFETNPLPKGIVCPGDMITTHVVNLPNETSTINPTNKYRAFKNAKMFNMLFKPVDTL